MHLGRIVIVTLIGIVGMGVSIPKTLLALAPHTQISNAPFLEVLHTLSQRTLGLSFMSLRDGGDNRNGDSLVAKQVLNQLAREDDQIDQKLFIAPPEFPAKLAERDVPVRTIQRESLQHFASRHLPGAIFKQALGRSLIFINSQGEVLVIKLEKGSPRGWREGLSSLDYGARMHEMVNGLKIMPIRTEAVSEDDCRVFSLAAAGLKEYEVLLAEQAKRAGNQYQIHCQEGEVHFMVYKVFPGEGQADALGAFEYVDDILDQKQFLQAMRRNAYTIGRLKNLGIIHELVSLFHNLGQQRTWMWPVDLLNLDHARQGTGRMHAPGEMVRFSNVRTNGPMDWDDLQGFVTYIVKRMKSYRNTDSVGYSAYANANVFYLMETLGDDWISFYLLLLRQAMKRWPQLSDAEQARYQEELCQILKDVLVQYVAGYLGRESAEVLSWLNLVQIDQLVAQMIKQGVYFLSGRFVQDLVSYSENQDDPEVLKSWREVWGDQVVLEMPVVGTSLKEGSQFSQPNLSRQLRSLPRGWVQIVVVNRAGTIVANQHLGWMTKLVLLEQRELRELLHLPIEHVLRGNDSQNMGGIVIKVNYEQMKKSPDQIKQDLSRLALELNEFYDAGAVNGSFILPSLVSAAYKLSAVVIAAKVGAHPDKVAHQLFQIHLEELNRKEVSQEQARELAPLWLRAVQLRRELFAPDSSEDEVLEEQLTQVKSNVLFEAIADRLSRHNHPLGAMIAGALNLQRFSLRPWDEQFVHWFKKEASLGRIKLLLSILCRYDWSSRSEQQLQEVFHELWKHLKKERLIEGLSVFADWSQEAQGVIPRLILQEIHKQAALIKKILTAAKTNHRILFQGARVVTCYLRLSSYLEQLEPEFVGALLEQLYQHTDQRSPEDQQIVRDLSLEYFRQLLNEIVHRPKAVFWPDILKNYRQFRIWAIQVLEKKAVSREDILKVLELIQACMGACVTRPVEEISRVWEEEDQARLMGPLIWPITTLPDALDVIKKWANCLPSPLLEGILRQQVELKLIRGSYAELEYLELIGQGRWPQFSMEQMLEEVKQHLLSSDQEEDLVEYWWNRMSMALEDNPAEIPSLFELYLSWARDVKIDPALAARVSVQILDFLMINFADPEALLLLVQLEDRLSKEAKLAILVRIWRRPREYFNSYFPVRVMGRGDSAKLQRAHEYEFQNGLARFAPMVQQYFQELENPPGGALLNWSFLAGRDERFSELLIDPKQQKSFAGASRTNTWLLLLPALNAGILSSVDLDGLWSDAQKQLVAQWIGLPDPWESVSVIMETTPRQAIGGVAQNELRGSTIVVTLAASAQEFSPQVQAWIVRHEILQALLRWHKPVWQNWEAELEVASLWMVLSMMSEQEYSLFSEEVARYIDLSRDKGYNVEAMQRLLKQLWALKVQEKSFSLERPEQWFDQLNAALGGKSEILSAEAILALKRAA